MLNSSRLYSFLDNERGFSIYFLEGQKLIHDLALLHDLKGQGFHFLRDTVLSSVQLINYLKPGESLGFYIDSDEPYFRFKIESSFNGKMRTLLLPTEFNQFPNNLTGKIRTTKMVIDQSRPYSSIINAESLATNELINKVISDSYQIQAKNILSDKSDQGILISKLPVMNSKLIDSQETLSIDEYIKTTSNDFLEIFNKAYNDIELIVNAFEGLGLSYLASKQISLECPCSKEQMIENLIKLSLNDVNEMFDDSEKIEIKCDYCKTFYDIYKSDFK